MNLIIEFNKRAPFILTVRRRRKSKRRPAGAPIVAQTPTRATVGGARFAIFFTVVAWLAYTVEQVMRVQGQTLSHRRWIETGAYLVIVTLLTLSALAYLLARLGYFEEILKHQRTPRSIIDSHFQQNKTNVNSFGAKLS